MRTIATLSAAAAALAVMLPQTAQAAEATAPITVPGYEFSLIGQHSMPGGARYAGTEIGAVTGVDYDQATGKFRFVSGDARSPRFYTGTISLAGNCPRPTLTGVSKLEKADGTAFTGVSPQALTFDAATGTVLWAGAGREVPAVREAAANGTYVGGFTPPQVQGAGSELTGVATVPNDGTVYSIARKPLAGDAGAVRLTLHGRTTGDPLVQFAYVPEAVAGNGVAEILRVDDYRFLVLEQAGTNSAKLYEINFFDGATNVASLPELAGQDYLPVTKRLVLDVTGLGLGRVDNLQAMTWGPQLADGANSLVLVSDNGLNDWKRTQLIAVRVRLSL
jgi:hypothetical protein